MFNALATDQALRTNLVLMSFIWSSTSVSYYIVNFYLKYLKGNLFTNTDTSVAAEALA